MIERRARYGSSAGYIAALGFLLTFGGSSQARSPRAPEVSLTTVVGIWEAVDPALPRLYVLSIAEAHPASVRLVSIVGPGTPVSIVFQATKFVLRGGRVVMHGEGEGADQDFVVDLEVAGTAFGPNGTMQGKISVRRRSEPPGPRHGPVVFIKGEEGFAQWLSGARAQAEGLLKTPRAVQPGVAPAGASPRR